MAANLNQVSFSEAEGLKRIPEQLKLQELSSELRNSLWSAIFEDIRESIISKPFGRFFEDPWLSIIERIHVKILNRPLDEFKNDIEYWVLVIKKIILNSKYNEVFDLILFLIRDINFNFELRLKIQHIFIEYKSCYRIHENHIISISNEIERENFIKIISSESLKRFYGSKSHLLKASEFLTFGKFSDSVRESIHAVESVCRLISDKNTIESALKIIEKKHTIHAAFKEGLIKIYAYTSDAEGIRHSLLEEKNSKVDETDALFMLGICASFTSYLISISEK